MNSVRCTVYTKNGEKCNRVSIIYLPWEDNFIVENNLLIDSKEENRRNPYNYRNSLFKK